MRIQPARLTGLICIVITVFYGVCLAACDKPAETVNSQRTTTRGPAPSPKAAPDDISVRIVAVLQRPAYQLEWINERQMLQLTPEEKATIASHGVRGKLEVVYTTARGSGSSQVRVVIIQTSPLKTNALLQVPKSGSAIYLQQDGDLKPLSPNIPVSSLRMRIMQEKGQTTFSLDYPRDGVTSGGSIFWWDEQGKWHPL
jgi:hypothetical protein